MYKILFRLAWQRMKERGIGCMALSAEFIDLTARVARQWIKERGIIDMHVRAKSGSVFCRNTNTFYNTFYTTMKNNELSYDSDQIRLCRRVHQ